MPFDKKTRPPMPEGKGLFGPKEEKATAPKKEDPVVDEEPVEESVPGLAELGEKYGLSPEEVESFIQDLGDLLAQEAGGAAAPAAPMGAMGPGMGMGPKGPVMG